MGLSHDFSTILALGPNIDYSNIIVNIRILNIERLFKFNFFLSEITLNCWKWLTYCGLRSFSPLAFFGKKSISILWHTVYNIFVGSCSLSNIYSGHKKIFLKFSNKYWNLKIWFLPYRSFLFPIFGSSYDFKGTVCYCGSVINWIIEKKRPINMIN
jgi:hypothetical protein